MRIAVVDYGMGNLRSVAKALEHVAPHAVIELAASPALVRRADRVVVPGQGAMPDCMRQLLESGLAEAVLESTRSKPFLGICIGLQMLFERSEEGDVSGLGVIPGVVRRFPSGMHGQSDERLKIPHMGWNQVEQVQQHPLWSGIQQSSRFYFVHSYYAEVGRLSSGVCGYGLPFTAAIARDNIFAVQFHPEKSQRSGLQMLDNFARWLP